MGPSRATLPEPSVSSPPTRVEGIAWFAWAMATDQFERGETWYAFWERHGKPHGIAESTVRKWSGDAAALRAISNPEAIAQARAETAEDYKRYAEKAELRSDGANDRDGAPWLKTAIDALDKRADVMGLKPQAPSTIVQIFTADGSIVPNAPEQVKRGVEARDRENARNLLSVVADRLATLNELTHEAVRLEIEALRGELTGEVET